MSPNNPIVIRRVTQYWGTLHWRYPAVGEECLLCQSLAFTLPLSLPRFPSHFLSHFTAYFILNLSPTFSLSCSFQVSHTISVREGSLAKQHCIHENMIRIYTPSPLSTLENLILFTIFFIHLLSIIPLV